MNRVRAPPDRRALLMVLAFLLAPAVHMPAAGEAVPPGEPEVYAAQMPPMESITGVMETGNRSSLESSNSSTQIAERPTMKFFVMELPDSAGGGFEPHILAASGVDGKEWYYIDSPTGLASKQSGNLWVSRDSGETWTYRPKGPGSASVGGSGDSYTAVAKDGTIYYTDLLLATASVQSSRDGGSTWVRNPVASVTPIDDRQWLSMGPTVRGTPLSRSETLYLSYNQIPSGLWIMRSQYTALGLGWKAGNRGLPVTGDVRARDLMAVDPHDGTVYLANTGASDLSVFVSTDGANSFKKMKVMDGPPEMFQSIFVVADVDEAGNLYLTWTDQRNVTLAVSADKANSWRFLTVTAGNGTRVLPWVAAGDAGRAGVTWYETNETGMSDQLDNATWDVRAAVTTDAFARNVTFYESTVAPAVHVGSIRTSGVSGSADRDLGDYFTGDVDAKGRLVMTFGYDGDDGSGKYMSKVMFARQVGGPFLRANTGPAARWTRDIEGLRVRVDANSSFDRNGGGIVDYNWSWGDGTNGTGSPAVHRYRAEGRYNITLTVTNRDNMSDSDTVRVRLTLPPQPSNGGALIGLGAAVAVAAGAYIFWRYRTRVKGAGPVP